MLPKLHHEVSLEQLAEELRTFVLPDLSGNPSFEELFTMLSAYLNHLITSDFHRLIALLYRLDISEKKLKTLLAENKSEQAGAIIATMILERQMQKIVARKFFKANNDIPEADKW